MKEKFERRGFMLVSSDTENLFCEKLIDLMEEKPLHQIRTTELVKCARTCRSTFYNYFDSVYAVLQKIEDDFFFELEKAIASHATQMKRDNPENIVAETVKFSTMYIKKNAKLIRVLTGTNGSLSFISKLKNIMRQANVNTISFTNPKLTKAQENFYYEYILAGQFSIVIWYAQHEAGLSDKDVDDIIQLALSMYWKLLVIS